ncbi:hypothetical protein [Helicobacter cappadocius]|uniref:Periplasmic protein n=1 Tax=Helicobacter cappadocius TaxID=3063998 RepID=A0AA90PJG7_9HELI|nr:MULTISPECIES: hypothetical protein [unclassified Helicobacter]MDO7253030.1 hypothetical protein [Helicobacter sp. faydin-H75]MDP2538981.1 hypothetical protein [Helicobacter sp. faydin-H76]
MYKRIFSFLACFVFLANAFVFASEDVLEDEESTNLEGRFQKTQFDSLDSFKWVYGTAVITAYFKDGSFKQGFALLLQNGLYLTSSQLTYHLGLYPQKIVAKMQDDSADPLICVAELQLKAMDSNKGLSLLKTSAFTDDYCNVRTESYYHKRIYDKYAQKIFSKKPTKDLIQNGLYFPVIKEADTFGVQRTYPIREETYYNEKLEKEVSYGYSLPFNSYEKFTFGKPYFDKNGDFLGIFSIIEDSYLPVLIKKEIVQQFICETEEKKILKGEISDSVCKNATYNSSSPTKIANNIQK